MEKEEQEEAVKPNRIKSWLSRTKKFCINRKQQIMKLSIVVLFLAGFTIGFYFIFDAFGLINPDAETRDRILADQGIWIYVIFILLFVVQALCLCMIPGNTTVFITLALILFDNFWVVLLVSVIGVWLSGLALFFVGRYAGRPIIYWLFGKDKVNKGLEWMTRKGAPFLPVFFLVPFMPNDMICAVCGMSKLRFWQFLMIIIPFRVIEVLMILSYRHLVDFFFVGRDPLEIIVFINVLLIDIFLITLYWRTFVKILRKTFFREKQTAKKLDVEQATEQVADCEAKSSKSPRRQNMSS